MMRLAHIPVLLMLSLVPGTSSAQTLETETARFHPAHSFQIASGFEQQFSAEGRESALPVAMPETHGGRPPPNQK